MLVYTGAANVLPGSHTLKKPWFEQVLQGFKKYEYLRGVVIYNCVLALSDTTFSRGVAQYDARVDGTIDYSVNQGFLEIFRVLIGNVFETIKVGQKL